jgi:small-conductance mechanosensitive channel
MSRIASLAARLALLLAAVLFWAGTAFALDESRATEAEQAAAEARARLQTIAAAVGEHSVTDEKLAEYRNDMDRLRGSLLAAGSGLDAPIKEVKEQLAKLPPAAVEGQIESPEIAAQRKLLNDIAGRLSGAQSQVKLLGVEVDQTEAKILTLQRDRFFEQILEPHSSILTPSLWTEAAAGFNESLGRIGGRLGQVWSGGLRDLRWLPLLVVLIAVTLLTALALFAQQIWRRRFFPTSEQTVTPDNLSRVWRVFWSVGATFAMSWVAVIVLAVLMVGLGIGEELSKGLSNAAFTFIIEVPAVLMLVRRLSEPSKPDWRVLPIDSVSARLFSWGAYPATILAGLTSAMTELAESVNLPVDNSIAVSAVTSLAMFVAMAVATYNLRDRGDGGTPAASSRPYYNWAGNFRTPVWLCIIAAAVALLLGYIALASYLLFNLFYTLIIIVVLFLITYLAEAGVRAAGEATSPLGRLVRRATGWSNKSIERSGLLVRTVIDVLLVVFGIPILIGLWAVNWIDFRSIANKVFFSFEIGNVTISPWTVLLVIGLLVFGISLTKLITRWLDRRILSHAHLDRGVQESVRTGINYAGYILAGGFALSAAGIDFSSFALIAGALGVGIGLGFQSVVNNFVSGIILLAERPVRVGDWIVTNAGEGLVKRINVRSTEIETFDGCSVIVPNSNLIMEPVKNWTLGNTIGRAAMQIVVEYGQDNDAIRELLLKIVTEHPQILHFPEPSVVVSKLLPIGVEFDVRGTVSDIFQAVHVSSDLRLAALKAFAAGGIIVFQQPGTPQA